MREEDFVVEEGDEYKSLLLLFIVGLGGFKIWILLEFMFDDDIVF